MTTSPNPSGDLFFGATPTATPLQSPASLAAPFTVTPSSLDSLARKLPPSLHTESDVKHLLRVLVDHGAYDFKFQHDCPVIAEIGGQLLAVTPRELTATEMTLILPIIGGTGADHRLPLERVVDTAYTFILGANRDATLRFRVNIRKADNEYQLSLRRLPDRIPFIGAPRGPDDLAIDLEPELIRAFRHVPKGRIAVVGGKNNSGKTWTTAAVIDDWRTHHPSIGASITMEDPIEFVHPKNPFTRPILQQEIGRDLESYAQGLRATTRANTTMIFLGEIRDRATVDGLIAATNQGPIGLATTHTTSVSGTPRRFTDFYDGPERRERARAILDVLGLVVTQFLVPKRVPDGAPPAHHHTHK
jgi:twitching motility protein PilT